MFKLLIRVVIAFITLSLFYLNIPWLTSLLTGLFIVSAVLATIGLAIIIFIRYKYHQAFIQSAKEYYSRNDPTYILAGSLLVALIYVIGGTILSVDIIIWTSIYQLFIAAILLDMINKANYDN